MTRIARCCCGQLRAEASADPVRVVVCHCSECRRRTGSAYGVSAYFQKDYVEVDGPNSTFVRHCPEGRIIEFRFCPSCGSTVYWRADLLPDLIGVAVGLFDDPAFPEPTSSIFERNRFPWVGFMHQISRFEGPVSQ
jgi:hypothetical protein